MSPQYQKSRRPHLLKRGGSAWSVNVSPRAFSGVAIPPGLRWNNTRRVSRDRATAGGKKIGTRPNRRCAGIRDVPQRGEFLPRQDGHAVSHQGPEIIPADGDPTGWPKPQASPPVRPFVRCILSSCSPSSPFPSLFCPSLSFLCLSFSFTPCSLFNSLSSEVRISLRVSWPRLPSSRVTSASDANRDRVIL